jgi:AhpC/TSA family
MNYKLLTVAMATVSAAALIGFAAQGEPINAASAVTQVAIPAKVDNFRLVDQKSKAHDLSYYKNSPAIVIVAQANGANFVRDAAPAFKALQDTYAVKGVSFFMINSTLTDNRDTIATELKTLGLDLPVLLDDTQLVGESMGVSHTGEVFVIDPRTWKVAYHGPLDDRFTGKSAKPKAKVKSAYVADTLDAMLAGKAVAISTVPMKSPAIPFPARERQADFSKISYETEISPILAKNCVACHSEGGIAPFAMNSYEMVKGFAPMIREAVRTDRMPPYNADKHVGQFKDSMNLSNKDEQTLVHWIEAGAPRGTTGPDPLKVNAKVAPEWELGKPDLVLTLPSYKVPASGVVDYQNPVLKNPMTEGRWLRASTIKVGDRAAVHHLLSPVGGYAVGAESTVAPNGTGSWIDPSTDLRFQLHYTPYGKETEVVTKIGLYFYPKDAPPKLIRRSAVIANPGIEIPPGEARHQEIAYVTFPADATLYTVFPHAHYRGENAQFFLQKPGQKEEMILSLPKYDFNWQRGYEFAKPISVPAGTKLITRYEYDNSKNNPANPDPTITVKWGEQSWEEMQYTAFGFGWNDETVANPKPEHMTALNASRSIGIMDANVDGKVARTEVRGRMGQMVTANFDKLDANKDGFLNEAELAAVTRMINGRINDAQAEQSIGQ